MRIDYISPAYFSDVDVSFLSELKKYAEVHYYVFSGCDVRGSAINITPSTKPGIYPASVFPQLDSLSDLIDLKHTTIIHRYPKSYKYFLLNLLITIRLCIILFRRKPDVVHITFILRHFEWPLYLFANKMVLSVHDPIEHSSTSSSVKRFYRRIAFCIPRKFVIFNKAQRKDFLEKYNLKEAQVINSQLGTYGFLRQMKQNEGIFAKIKEKQYILFFGTITRYKGLDILLEAMKEVHKVLPDLNVVVAGGGHFYFDVDEYSKLNYVTLINRFIQNDELATLIKNSLFVVCPYRDATQSGVIMSSFALSKPVLATNVGGLAEMVKNDKSGIIISPDNVKILVDAIVHLFNDKPLLDKMSNYISDEYEKGQSSWKKIVENMWDDLYSKQL